MKTTRLLIISIAWLCAWLVTLVPAMPQERGTDVAATRHNLTATGPGSIRVAGAKDVCRFCHTPHAANPIAPLWNRQDPGTYYQTYDSSTLVSSVGQPTGSSRLCLSCHDGTIALTQTYNPRNAPGGGTIYITQADRGFLGTDLSDDHPISFVYDSTAVLMKGQMRDPSTLPPQLPLDHESRVQCATCHDPHDDSRGKFMRMDNTESRLCLSCHNPDGWQASAHATSPASLALASQTWDNLDAASVREAGCGSCHRPHTAGGRQRLLRLEAEEDNCLSCHDGGVAQTDLRRALAAISTHPVRRTTGKHDPAESPSVMVRHVECADCHDPHQTGTGPPAQAPFIKPAMAGATGASGVGGDPTEARYEYEVCYKCHAQRNVSRAIVDRMFGNNDISDEFATVNASYHPVEAQGRNGNVPSLLQEYNTASIIYCTDCHGSDNPQDAAGPHGSRYSPLLTDNYNTQDNAVESPQAFALCYRCHSRASILDDKSFKKHREHIEEGISCAACHDPHGVRENTHLINFDRAVARPSVKAGAGPTFTDLGNTHGSCTLLCHGEDHDDESY